jgi:hypothetical protein
MMNINGLTSCAANASQPIALKDQIVTARMRSWNWKKYYPGIGLAILMAPLLWVVGKTIEKGFVLKWSGRIGALSVMCRIHFYFFIFLLVTSMDFCCQ